MTQFTAAVIQMSCGTSMTENVENLRTAIAHAAKSGADFVQTPEMTGLVQGDRELFFQQIHAEENDPIVRTAAELAREHALTLHIGSTPISLGNRMAANRAYVFGPQGQRLATYDKIHMFDVDLDHGESWRESAVYAPGNRAVMLTACGARIGLGICYDCRFPALFATYGQAGAEVLTSPSCFTKQTGQAHWHTLLRARAIENNAFLIAAAQGGKLQDGRDTFGHSLIIDPWGKIIAEVDGDQPGMAMTEIDTALVHQARGKVPNLSNTRPFKLDEIQ